jgi:hypothetical protein
MFWLGQLDPGVRDPQLNPTPAPALPAFKLEAKLVDALTRTVAVLAVCDNISMRNA